MSAAVRPAGEAHSSRVTAPDQGDVSAKHRNHTQPSNKASTHQHGSSTPAPSRAQQRTHGEQGAVLRCQAEASGSALLRAGICQQGQQVLAQHVSSQLHGALVRLGAAASVGVPGSVPRLAVHAGVCRRQQGAGPAATACRRQLAGRRLQLLARRRKAAGHRLERILQQVGGQAPAALHQRHQRSAGLQGVVCAGLGGEGEHDEVQPRAADPAGTRPGHSCRRLFAAGGGLQGRPAAHVLDSLQLRGGVQLVQGPAQLLQRLHERRGRLPCLGGHRRHARVAWQGMITSAAMWVQPNRASPAGQMQCPAGAQLPPLQALAIQA